MLVAAGRQDHSGHRAEEQDAGTGPRGAEHGAGTPESPVSLPLPQPQASPWLLLGEGAPTPSFPGSLKTPTDGLPELDSCPNLRHPGRGSRHQKLPSV